ncbi:hypothetical protein BK128_13300 [Viridibacillus sp. FSL H7-0596]|uniref:hypothetical protein n=1 Tax=unclassified Viridibacillus TaxID=2617942 RepID=UPI00096C1C08|nr:hypothetical protein [Viridibacillus sp. FSL H7-0596]OMC86002.1 hypothetical protein BK128_13300 [Viridibacillus sp. FSL H7-0596]
MEIYSLSGPSGTGKSTAALEFAHTHQIDAIIDDGLLIVNGEKVAGLSAKFEKSPFKAVKRAIFTDEEHLQDVQEAIDQHQPKKILLIGTSDKMTIQIAKRLGYGDIDHFYYISDLRSSGEMKLAQFIRKTEGKHIMPIPLKQVEQNFFKRFIQKGVEIFTPKREKIGETTIVQPDFHDETITIQKKAFTDMVKITCDLNSNIEKSSKIQYQQLPLPSVHITVALKGPIDYSIPDAMMALQKDIAQQFDTHFDLELAEIRITVNQIQMIGS